MKEGRRESCGRGNRSRGLGVQGRREEVKESEREGPRNKQGLVKCIAARKRPCKSLGFLQIRRTPQIVHVPMQDLCTPRTRTQICDATIFKLIWTYYLLRAPQIYNKQIIGGEGERESLWWGQRFPSEESMGAQKGRLGGQGWFGTEERKPCTSRSPLQGKPLGKIGRRGPEKKSLLGNPAMKMQVKRLTALPPNHLTHPF